MGACNPPTDPGRHAMSKRFMRHSPLILVDFPSYDSLVQIYGTFNKAMLAPYPDLRKFTTELTKAMVEYYCQSQKRFTSDIQPHYIYSPRELTRWKHAINEALSGIKDIKGLIRLWAHEALRLFEDRLVTQSEKKWCQESLDRIAKQCFSKFEKSVLERPILFSSYLTKQYANTNIEELRSYI